MPNEETKKIVDIDQDKLLEDCRDFGLLSAVIAAYAKEQKLDCPREASEFYAAICQLPDDLSEQEKKEAKLNLMLAHLCRRCQFKDRRVDFPSWDPEDHHHEDCHDLSDLFFVIQSLRYFRASDGYADPGDFLGPLFFLAGAINEDIAIGYHADPASEVYRLYEKTVKDLIGPAKLKEQLSANAKLLEINREVQSLYQKSEKKTPAS